MVSLGPGRVKDIGDTLTNPKEHDMASHMKTTIHIADGLFEEARKVARQEKTTLKALVDEGLRKVVAERQGPEARGLQAPPGVVQRRRASAPSGGRDLGPDPGHRLRGAWRMIAVDSNILVYAHREDSPWHAASLQCLTGLAEGRAPWAIPWPCIHEFLAITTHPRIYAPPTPLETGGRTSGRLARIAEPRPAGRGRRSLGPAPLAPPRRQDRGADGPRRPRGGDLPPARRERAVDD